MTKNIHNMWNVYLNGRLIDSIWYTKNCDRDYVKDSLINHDNYHPNIKVCKARK